MLSKYNNLVFCLVVVCLMVISSSIAEAADPILWFHFEGTGDTVEDGSGNGNQGTIVGATRAPGKYGKGISIGKADQYVELPNLLQAAGTLEFWFKPNWDGNDAETYRLYDGTLDPIFFVIGKGKGVGWPQLDDTIGLVFENAADNDREIMAPIADFVVAGEWHHFAATWDYDEAGGTGGKVYINGEVAREIGALGGLPPLNPDHRIGFNADPGYFPAHNGADSIIDEFAIYDVILDDDEIQRDMAQLGFAVEPSDKLPVMWGKIKQNVRTAISDI